uniref:Uncharacterized protein n=1 Tax=Tetranychus urticae TaxID=32264 RepID=T1JTT9_TETUR
MCLSLKTKRNNKKLQFTLHSTELWLIKIEDWKP